MVGLDGLLVALECVVGLVERRHGGAGGTAAGACRGVALECCMALLQHGQHAQAFLAIGKGFSK